MAKSKLLLPQGFIHFIHFPHIIHSEPKKRALWKQLESKDLTLEVTSSDQVKTGEKNSQKTILYKLAVFKCSEYF